MPTIEPIGQVSNTSGSTEIDNRLDTAIFEAEEAYAKSGEAIDLDVAKRMLDKKYYGGV